MASRQVARATKIEASTDAEAATITTTLGSMMFEMIHRDI
jgi:hypothetical protein